MRSVIKNGSLIRMLTAVMLTMLLICAVGLALAEMPESGAELASKEVHTYPTGTPTLTLTASATSVLTRETVTLTVQSSASELTLWEESDGSLWNQTMSYDSQTGTHTVLNNRIIHRTSTFWAEAVDGTFSNKVTVEWISYGALSEPTNICINGTPISEWEDKLVARVPYTLTFDAIEHAAEYSIHAYADDDAYYLYSSFAAEKGASYTFACPDVTDSFTLSGIMADAIGYDHVYSDCYALGAVSAGTDATLTLSASSATGTNIKPITFTVETEAESAQLCYFTNDNPGYFYMKPMEKINGVFTATISEAPFNGLINYTVWALDSDGAVSQDLNAQINYQGGSEHTYPTGTPTLTLTSDVETALTCDTITFSVQSEADSLSFYAIFGDGDYVNRYDYDSFDYDTNTYSAYFCFSTAEPIRIWAEDTNGAFSNIVTASWTVNGDLAEAQNIRINGTPLESWREGFIVGVPYTVTFDSVLNADDYSIVFNTNDKYLRNWINASASPSVSVVFFEPANSVRLNNLQASGRGFNASNVFYSANLGAAYESTSEPLALTASSDVGWSNIPIAFDLASDADTATLCYRRDDDDSTETMPMTKKDGGFTALLNIEYGEGIYQVWAADSNSGVSQRFTVEFKSNDTIVYPEGTPTLTLSASALSVLTGQRIDFNVNSSAPSLSFILDGHYALLPDEHDAATGDYGISFCYWQADNLCIWAKDTAGNFSNKLPISWTSSGRLPMVSNIRFNGVPIADWSGEMTARVPNTVTFDKVEGASKFIFYFLVDGRGCEFNPVATDASSYRIVFPKAAQDVRLAAFMAYGIGYDSYYQGFNYPLGKVVAAPEATLTLTSSATTVQMGKPITFSMASSASSATLFIQNVQPDYDDMHPCTMTKIGDTFVADQSAMPTSEWFEPGVYTVWAADGNGAISQELTIEWTKDDPTQVVTSFTVPDKVFLSVAASETMSVSVSDILPAESTAADFVWRMTGQADVTGRSCTISADTVPSVRTMTVTAPGGVARSIRVVSYQAASALTATMPERRLLEGDTLPFSLSIVLDSVTYSSINDMCTITSSDPDVVSYSNGVLSAGIAGTATITASLASPSAPKAFAITVYAPNTYVMPQGLTTIETEAFAGTTVEVVRLNGDCTSIGSRAFANCAMLQHAYIPSSVETIEADAFAGCALLTIHGVSGSRAQTYANEHSIPFIPTAE